MDQIVGLEIVHLDMADAECLRRPADVLQLRREVVGHFTAVGLVFAVDLVAEASPGRVEYHRDVVGIGFPQILVQHVAEYHDDFGRHAVRFTLEPLGFRVAGAREVGAKDEARAVDQEHMVRRRRGCRLRFGDNSGRDVVHARLLSSSEPCNR